MIAVWVFSGGWQQTASRSFARHLPVAPGPICCACVLKDGTCNTRSWDEAGFMKDG